MNPRDAATAPDWQQQILPILKQFDVKHVVYVPDAGHSAAIRAAEQDNGIVSLALTTEEEGIGYLAGAWLGGERGALLMQSSGVGNCLNTLALQTMTRFPLLMLVTMRGDWAEFNPWQNPMGQATEPSLKLMGVRTWRADKAEDVARLVHGAATMAFNGDEALRGAARPKPDRRKEVGEAMTTGTLDRRAVAAALVTDRRDLLVVTGLGSASYDAFAAGDHDQNYYLWAAMGSAATVGFGLAMAQRARPVLVLTGDGEMLMGMGALASIAQKLPPNLTIAVLDNGHYGETGMQLSHSGRGLELSRVAAACNFTWTGSIGDMAGVTALRDRIHARSGTTFATIKIAADELPRALPPRDGVYVKNRFRSALGLKTI